MACAEAPDWDLGPFLTACLDPPQMTPERLGGGVTPADFREAPAWLREAYPELFAHPALRERLTLYEVVLRSRELTADPAHCVEVIEAARMWVRAFEPLLPQ